MTAARVALDTNFLVYAQGVDGEAKKQAALDLIEKMPEDALVVPVRGPRRAVQCSCEQG